MSNLHEIDTLGGRIANARELSGLGAAQLAKRLGVKTKTLLNWESDKSQPRANRLAMLGGALGVSPSWLLAGFGDGPVADLTTGELRMAMRALDQARNLHQQTADLLLGLQRQLEAMSTHIDDEPLAEDDLARG
jgi:transcriptional regulator with XRE-family HTH domain